MTDQQIAEIIDFWGGYQSLFPIDPVFHSFYQEKTGHYDVRYMPWDIHYCYVDTFYNNWNIAPVIDNKCTYARLFKDTRQPETLFCRINNIWVDADYQLISKEQMYTAIRDTDEVVMK